MSKMLQRIKFNLKRLYYDIIGFDIRSYDYTKVVFDSSKCDLYNEFDYSNYKFTDENITENNGKFKIEEIVYGCN